MQTIDPTELERAKILLRERNFTAAEEACRTLLARAPRNAAVTHLLGLVRKDAGDTNEGERLLRESIALEPRQPEFRSNLANLLRRQGGSKEAESLYRQALQLDPGHRPAQVGLVLALSDLGRHGEAEAESRRLLSSNDRDSRAWSLLAMTLRDQMRLPEAEQAYRRAIASAPDGAEAHHNLGSVLMRMERAEEALQALDRAGSLGLTGFELAFNRGRALLALYKVDDAEQAFSQAVAINPRHPDAQVNLARIRYMRGDARFARTLADAAATYRDDTGLQLLHGLILRRAGDAAAAESLLRDLIKRKGSAPEVRAALAEVLHEDGRLKEAEDEILEAAGDRPDDPFIRERLVAILLARGRPEDAVPFIQEQRKRHPTDQGWLAYEATAARLLGQPRYRELYDYGRFVRIYDIEPPAGWTSIEDLNAALGVALGARHQFATHPLDQSLRNGSQTARSLLTDADPAIQAVLRAFEAPIRAYRRAVGRDPAHPLTARNSGEVRYTGAWSVQLRREGFHVNHFHPHGWISSAYYVSVPGEIADLISMSGWLKFGETRYPVPGAGAETFVQPRAGRLVLFPSYMWHGTNPIHGPVPRTTIAFDVAPEPPAAS